MITVIYGGSDIVGTCLRSAQRSADVADVDLEIVIVDNNPGDGTMDAALTVAPTATTIVNDENVGFARACNQGFEVASGDWWLLLNPDALLEEEALRELLSFAREAPDAGAVAPILTGAGFDKAESSGMRPGLRSAIGHFWLVNRLLRGDRGGPWRGLQLHRRTELGPRRMDWASGGALLLRPDAVREVGGFDRSFFLYAEDVDLGTRLTEHGWQCWLVPSARAEHTIAAASPGGVTARWLVALHHLYARDANRASVIAFDLVSALGLTMRALATQKQLHRHRMWTSARVAFRLAASVLRSG